jgi:hypothetical protein
LAGVSRPTVDLWLSRFAAGGVSGLLDRRRGVPREQMPAAIRGRVLALTRTSPPAVTGLSHWSSRELAALMALAEIPQCRSAKFPTSGMRGMLGR